MINVLMVDDDEDDLKLMERAFKKEKYDVNLRTCLDGTQALDLLNQQKKLAVDLRTNFIFLDLNMPRKDGFEVLQEIKQDQFYKKIPVVIFSTSSSQQDISRCYRLGCNCFIQKPDDFSTLSHIFDELQDLWFKIIRLPLESTPIS